MNRQLFSYNVALYLPNGLTRDYPAESSGFEDVLSCLGSRHKVKFNRITNAKMAKV